MKARNFELINTKGSSILDRIFYAKVEIKKGFLWNSRFVQVNIFKNECSLTWRYANTGEFTPTSVGNLAKAYAAANGLSF